MPSAQERSNDLFIGVCGFFTTRALGRSRQAEALHVFEREPFMNPAVLEGRDNAALVAALGLPGTTTASISRIAFHRGDPIY